MLNRNELSDNDKKILKIFEGLEPFTITVTSTEDALFLAEGLLLKMGCAPDLMSKTIEIMVQSAAISDTVQEGVELFFSVGKKRGFYYPKFMVGIFVHLFTHLKKKANEDLS